MYFKLSAGGKSVSKVKFVCGDYVVLPAHGLGQIKSFDTVSVFGKSEEYVSVRFIRDRMTVSVPLRKLQNSGIRPVYNQQQMQKIILTLANKTKVRRAMWSRRAHEYEAKIHTGDPREIAKVLRELYRNENQGEPSFSERQIYQTAMHRLASELAIVERIDENSAVQKLEEILHQAA